MPSHLFTDRPASQPPERGTVDALITQTRRLRGGVDAVRRESAPSDDDTLVRWQRALCDLAVRQLDDLGANLDQLREGKPDEPADQGGDAAATGSHPAPADSLLRRVGSAEWNLLTDEVSWSDELYRILGLKPESGPMSLDELPSLVFADDQILLTAMVTGCLVDGRPIDGEFRIVRPDGGVRTLHMTGEPVLDAQGCTASMWAVLRDVSELRRSEQTVRASLESHRRREHIAQAEQRLVVELQQAVLPSWQGPLGMPTGLGPTGLDLAGHYLPAESSRLIGGDWYDALDLPTGETLLSVGDLTGHGVSAASVMAMLLGALRGMAVAGIEPGSLLGHVNQLLETSRTPALTAALCARYSPTTRTLTYAQAGHPAPLLFRNGAGRPLTQPDGVLLGATAGATYEHADIQLRPGDLLLLHTNGLTREGGMAGQDKLLALAPRLGELDTAEDCAREVVEHVGRTGRENDACVLVARIRD